MYPCRYECGKGPWAKAGPRGMHEKGAHGSVWGKEPVASVTQLHEAVEAVIAEAPEFAPPRHTGPAIIDHWRQYPQPQYGVRSITMLRPICRECQGQENSPVGWWLSCTHDPYVTMRRVKAIANVYEGERTEAQVLASGQPARVIRQEEVISFSPYPNAVEIAASPKVNGGSGVRMAEGKGFILPSELRSPHFPNGIVEPCEYRACRWQQGLKSYVIFEDENGYVTEAKFCRDQEARLVKHTENPDYGALEVGFDELSRRKRRTQLQAVL